MFRKIKWFFQRLFRGYSDYDMINFYEFLLGRKVLPYLKAWVKRDRCGYPVEFETMKEWNEVLDEIVWAIEEVVTHKNEDRVFDEYRRDNDGEKFHKDIEENWNRASKGMELFGKYVTAMWD